MRDVEDIKKTININKDAVDKRLKKLESNAKADRIVKDMEAMNNVSRWDKIADFKDHINLLKA